MELKLTMNNGYKWSASNDISFKGYFSFFDNPTTIYREETALSRLAEIDDYNAFLDFLKKIDGIYAIVIKKDDGAFIAVDRSRALPLYYDDLGEFISDRAESVKDFLGKRAVIDQDHYNMMLSAGYTIANDTVFVNIRQLDMGQACRIMSGKPVHEDTYFYHINEVCDRSEEDLINYLSGVADKVFEKLKAAIAGRPVVISMSGGYDSRFVGCMLKRAGIEDVSCYTYGKLDSFEVKQSKKNAEALGYRWKCVEHTDDDVKGVLDAVGKKYLNEYNQHDFTAYIQNFPAVRSLHEEGWFKPGSVFITGLCGDMPTGYYIKEYDKETKYDSVLAALELYDYIYGRLKLIPESEQKQLSELKEMVESVPVKIDSYQSYVTAVDAVLTGTSHSRMFMHMNDVHDFFGYEWLLPFWDSELLRAWYSVPAEKRHGQKTYEKFLLDYLCAPYGIDQKKTVMRYSVNPKIQKIKRHVGGMLNCLFLNLHIPFRRSYDFSNFAPLELELFKNLKSRRWVVYKRAGLRMLLNQYTLMDRYDLKHMKCANKSLVKE